MPPRTIRNMASVEHYSIWESWICFQRGRVRTHCRDRAARCADLRLGIDALRVVGDNPEEERNSADLSGPALSDVRRSTLIEFWRGLTTVKLTADSRPCPSRQRKTATRRGPASAAHWDQLKALRNEFGGHVELQCPVRHATLLQRRWELDLASHRRRRARSAANPRPQGCPPGTEHGSKDHLRRISK
jgi:hypothetical protein